MKVVALVLLLIAAALGELRAEERRDVQRAVPAERYSLASLDPAVIRAAFSVYPQRQLMPRAPAGARWRLLPEPSLPPRQ